MGYSTFFTGAIKVTPKVDHETVINLNAYFHQRHHHGMDLPEVQNLMSKKAWEPNGPGVADIQPYIDDFKDKHPMAKDHTDDFISSFIWVPEIETKMSNFTKPENYSALYNHERDPRRSLWSDIKLYQSDDCTYIAWDNSEKAYAMGEWFTHAVKILKNLGYNCNGTVRAQGEEEDDRWTVYVENNNTKIFEDHKLPPTHNDKIQDIYNLIDKIYGY